LSAGPACAAAGHIAGPAVLNPPPGRLLLGRVARAGRPAADEAASSSAPRRAWPADSDEGAIVAIDYLHMYAHGTRLCCFRGPLFEGLGS